MRINSSHYIVINNNNNNNKREFKAGALTVVNMSKLRGTSSVDAEPSERPFLTSV